KIEANSKESRIVCGKRHTVFFEVGGGAEMPQFTLVLRLQPLNVEDDDHSQDIRLTAVWTAFGEAGTNTYRTVHRPDVDPDPNINYTFSSRLHNVTFKQLTHSKETAKDCDAKEGNNGWGIWWSHTHPPYCLGFRFPLEAMQFSPQQSEAVKAFRRLSSADMEMMVATQRQGNLADRWRFMAAMPVPTPGLFPYYDCRWAGEHNRFANITDIPLLTDNTIRIHHGLQETGWMNNPPAFSTPFKIVSMGEKAPLTFLNEREYEIFKTVGLLREAQWQKDNKDRVYDQEYQFNLIPADQVHRSGDSSMEDFYYALIDASPKIAVQDSESEHDLTLPPPGTQLEVDTGRPRHQAMAGRGPAPSRDDHRWKGFVVATPKLIDDDARTSSQKLCILIKRPPTGQSRGIVLQGISGRITFGSPNPAYAQPRTALRTAMYGNQGANIPRDNIMKRLLLGHENGAVQYDRSTGIISAEARRYLSDVHSAVNPGQHEALQHALTTLKGSLKFFVTVIVGPPGTGKTVVSTHLAVHLWKTNKKTLIVCGSNYGLDVITERIRKALGVHSHQEGFYRLDTEFGESHSMKAGFEKYDKKVSAAGLPFSSQELRDLETVSVSPKLLERLQTWIASWTDSNSDFSLGAYIIKRLGEFSDRSAYWPQDEVSRLQELIQWQWALDRMRMGFVESTAEEFFSDGPDNPVTTERQAFLGFVQAWKTLQKYYVSRARLVLCTATTAGRAALRNYSPSYAIVEEASQMTETVCLNGFVRFCPSLEKVVLSGDPAQLPPTVTSSDANECFASEKLSLHERLIKSQFPSIQLTVQYRMAPSISKFPSDHFYKKSLVNHPTCKDRPDSKRFRAVMKGIPGIPGKHQPGNSYFVSVKNSEVWRPKGSHSLFNPQYVVCVGLVAQALVRGGFKEEQILILSYYNEERRIIGQFLHKHHSYEKIRISSVDGAQGNESDVVILSTTRPGGNFGLGFVADVQRQCVAMTRARDGLVIVGDVDMARRKTSSGFVAWNEGLAKSTPCFSILTPFSRTSPN
ncbi:hypothetical protein FQN52_003261, partial [Onygenales sp. PD_12]